MTTNERFLLGKGERLAAHVPGPNGNPPPGPAYSFEEAIERLAPEVEEVRRAFDALPTEACPDNEAVAVVTLHPQSLAKSYHPKKLLDQYNLRQVGSRPVEVTPEKWTRQGEPQPSHSTELYVAGDRLSFEKWAADFGSAPMRIHEAIQRLEEVRASAVGDRIRNIDRAEVTDDGLLVELVLHASATDGYIIDSFAEFATRVGVDARIDRRLFAGGLCFVPAAVPPESLKTLAQFSFLRVARPLSRLRGISPVERATSMPGFGRCDMPSAEVVDEGIRVAIFDGGLPPTSSLVPWINPVDPPGVGVAVTELQQHGHDVSSALLFGSLTPGTPAGSPFARADHYRVLDEDSRHDPFELYDVLQRIDSTLSENKYDFVNLSIGPYVTIEDDDVHPWTAILDSHLSSGQTLVAIAAGNNGDADDPTDRRVQVPSDCVNAFTLGAADSVREGWARAPYSAIGPGRAPGFVKPDVLDFGGSATEPFIVSDQVVSGDVAVTMGTSFAAPTSLRRAIALRAHFGTEITPLGIKALLVHSARDDAHDRVEVGWGRLPSDLRDVVACGDGQVRIIYQGTLTPAKYLRALIPLPPDSLSGNVNIHATFAFATEIDPEDPGNYSRAGLDITFRPHDQRFAKDDAVDPKPGPFFRRSAYDTEGALRRDAQLWETTLNASRTLRGTSLHNPVFDVHYNARANGGSPVAAHAIPYALVVTVESPRTANLYDQVVRTFAGQLEVIQPVIDLPVRI